MIITPQSKNGVLTMYQKQNENDAMYNALHEVLNKHLPICSAADKYNLPRVAIYRAIRAQQTNTTSRINHLHNAKVKLEKHIEHIQSQLSTLKDTQTS